MGLQPLLGGVDRLGCFEGALRQLTRAGNLIRAEKRTGERAEDLGADLAGEVTRQQGLCLLEHGERLAVTGEIAQERGTAHE